MLFLLANQAIIRDLENLWNGVNPCLPSYFAVPWGVFREGAETFLCMNCGMRFNKKSNADDHFIRKHLPPKPSQCHICLKVFRNPPALKRHRAKAHGISNKMFNAATANAAKVFVPESALWNWIWLNASEIKTSTKIFGSCLIDTVKFQEFRTKLGKIYWTRGHGKLHLSRWFVMHLNFLSNGAQWQYT